MHIPLFIFPPGSCQFPTLGFVVERVCIWYFCYNNSDDSVVYIHSKTEDFKQEVRPLRSVYTKCTVPILFYLAINSILSRINANVRLHVIGCHTKVVSVGERTMATTAEEVCFEINSSFYFRENIIEQYFGVLLGHIAP